MLSIRNSETLDLWLQTFLLKYTWMCSDHLIELFRYYWSHNNDAYRDTDIRNPAITIPPPPLYDDSVFHDEVIAHVDFDEIDSDIRQLLRDLMLESNVDYNDVATIIPLTTSGDYLLIQFSAAVEPDEMDTIRDELLSKRIVYNNVSTMCYSFNKTWQRGDLNG
jgi:hypothetical protein